MGFLWLDTARNRARAAGSGGRLLDGGSGVQEVLVDFKDGKLSGVVFSLYNRGDAGEIPRAAFEATIQATKESLTRKFGVPGEDYKPAGKSAVRAEAWLWQSAGTAALLEASGRKTESREFRGEFIRLRLAPATRHKIGESTAPKRATRADLLARVRKESNGDVWIDGVPMVDQGQKGYCVVASCQRVMEYYGLATDQHELAQLAGSEVFGTTSEGMLKALDTIESRMGLDVRDFMRWDYRDFLRALDTYDRLAKARPGSWRPKADPRDKNVIFDEQAVYLVADPELMREARTSGGRLARFQKMVGPAIDQGIPLLWTLMVGIYPEQGAEAMQRSGGHMRVIIGYNEKEGEILFTDSWGQGHEKKRMKTADALAATTGLYGMLPRK